jgi:DNA-binding transcriptional ArsR family regulator
MTSKREQQQRRKTLRPHPARDEIVDAMRSYGKPISATRLAVTTSNSVGSVTYHMRTLRTAGIIELADEGRVRGAVEYFYALVPDHADELNDPLIELQKLCGVLTLPRSDGYPEPIELDDEARAALHKALNAVRPKVARIVSAAAKRAAQDSQAA